jgi:uncharacterized protein
MTWRLITKRESLGSSFPHFLAGIQILDDHGAEGTMKESDLNIAMELKKRIAALVQLVDFRVFGSRARGDADEYSDLDVFVEVERLDSSLKERLLDIAWEVGFENFMVISPLIYTRDEIENSAHRSSPVVRVIAHEGVPV